MGEPVVPFSDLASALNSGYIPVMHHIRAHSLPHGAMNHGTPAYADLLSALLRLLP